MSIFTHTKDGAEKQREDRAVIAAEFERRRIAEEESVRIAAPAAESSEEREARSKALLAARQAATAQRNAEIQKFLDLKQAALHLAAQAEAERNEALSGGDIETAITCQMRVDAAGALPALITADISRRFPPLGFHF